MSLCGGGGGNTTNTEICYNVYSFAVTTQNIPLVSRILESVDLTLQGNTLRHRSLQDQGARGTYEMNTLTSLISWRRSLVNRDISTFIQCLERSILLVYKVLELITDLEIKIWHLLRFITPITKSRKSLPVSFTGNKREQPHTHRPTQVLVLLRWRREHGKIKGSQLLQIFPISLMKQAVYSI